MFKILFFVAFVASANSGCLPSTSSTGAQDVVNAAYIFKNANGNLSNNGNMCEMRLCPGDSNAVVPLWNTSKVDFINLQMCNSTDAAYLGCTPDTYVNSLLVNNTWYGQGCKFCSSTCDATNANPVNAYMGGKRNPQYLRFFETNYDGRRCHMMQCGDSGCVDTTLSPGNMSKYAYFPANSGMPQFVFPDPADPFKTVSRSDWTEFDVPTAYDCAQSQPSPSGFLCDQAATNTSLWKGARSWDWVAGTPECKITECNSNDAMIPLYSTAEIGTSTIKAPWRNYIASKCASRLRGCLNNPTNWYWGRHAGSNTDPTSADCAAPTLSTSNFCLKLACKCSASTDAKVYTVETNTAPFTGSGVVLPDSWEVCWEGTCLAADTSTPPLYPTLMSSTMYTDTETSYWRTITSCPSTKYYFDGTTNTPSRGTVHAGVPIAYRFSTDRNSVSHGVQSEIFCSALGYTIPVSTAKCYRTNLYEQLSLSNTIDTISIPGSCTFSVTPSQAISSLAAPGVTADGPRCSTLSSSSQPCISTTRAGNAVEYQSASVFKYDKYWVEYQCFANASNFRMENNCEAAPNDKIRELVGQSADTCYAGNGVLNTYLQANCRDRATSLSNSAAPQYTTDLLMQTNQCDAFRFKALFGKVAECECSRVTNLGSGGDANYVDQLKNSFKGAYESVLTRPSNTNRLLILQNDLRSLGCTYRATCTGGVGSVTVVRPKFSATFIVRTSCKSVDWANLRSNLQTVFDNYGGNVASNRGRFGGVQLNSLQATDGTDASINDPKFNKICKVPFWTYWSNPEKGKWFYGNLTSTTSTTPPLPTSSIEANSATFTANDASAASVATNGSVRVSLHFALLLVVLSLLAMN